MNQDKSVEVFSEPTADVLMSRIDPKSVRAVNAIRTGKVPREHIKTHIGKGKQEFSYIPHTIATDTLLNAFGETFDWEVTSHDVFADGSAIAYGRLTIHYFDNTGKIFHTRTIQEPGGREPITKDGKVVSITAFTVLGAASRSLLRCMMRAFGYGLELYKEDDPETTVEQAFKLLEELAKSVGLKDQRDLWVNALKDVGISRENMLDRYKEAYELIKQTAANFKEESRQKAMKEAAEKKQKEDERKNQLLKEKLASSKKEPEPA